jgi:hypothetical protein
VRLVKAKCKARGWTITAVKEPFVSLNLELVVQHDVSFWIEISKPDGKTDKYEEHVHLPQTAKISLYAASRVGLLTTFGTEYVLPPVFCVAMILCRVLA